MFLGVSTVPPDLSREAAGGEAAPPEDFGAILTGLSLRLAPLAGRAFIEEFARAAAAASKADYFLIGRLNPYSNMMRSVCLIADGEIAPNITYSLNGTPCARTIDSDICLYDDRVAEQFPLDTLLSDLGIAGYVGTALRDQDGRPFGVIVALTRGPYDRAETARAILDRFRQRVGLEVEAVETIERYRLAAEGGADGIWDWDIRTGDMVVAERVSVMLGYEPGERFFDLSLLEDALHKDDREAKNAALTRLLKHDVPFDVVVRLRGKEGAYRWFRLRANAIRNAKGAVVRMVGSIGDVDDLIEKRGR